MDFFFWIFRLLVFCKSFQLHQRLYIFGIILLESNGRKKNRKKRSSNVEHFSFILIDCYSRRVCYSRHSTKKSIYLLLYPYSILPLHSFCSFHFISIHFFSLFEFIHWNNLRLYSIFIALFGFFQYFFVVNSNIQLIFAF